MSVSVDKFGKDHWSTFAYLETRVVDYGGKLKKAHMRTDIDRHPQHHASQGVRKYPTRLFGMELLENHDDWDCIDDLISAGLVYEPADRGTGLFPIYQLTELGWEIANQLRTHKANGGNFSEFIATME